MKFSSCTLQGRRPLLLCHRAVGAAHGCRNMDAGTTSEFVYSVLVSSCRRQVRAHVRRTVLMSTRLLSSQCMSVVLQSDTPHDRHRICSIRLHAAAAQPTPTTCSTLPSHTIPIHFLRPPPTHWPASASPPNPLGPPPPPPYTHPLPSHSSR